MRIKFFTVTVLTLVALTSLGCGPISNISRQGATIDVSLSEERVDGLLRRAEVMVDESGQAVLEQITEIDFRDGVIHVEGTYSANGATQTGSVDLEMSATNGQLNVQLTNVDIAGVDPAQIERANEELAREFAAAAEQGDVEFRDVTVTDTEVQMTIRISFQQGQ